MAKRNALIFSKNENISKIIFAELSLLGYIPQILDRPPYENNADVIVFDTTMLEITSTFKSFLSLGSGAKTLAVVNDPSEKLQVKFDKSLCFPFSLSEFRNAILNTDSTSAQASTASETKCFVCDDNGLGVSLNNVYIPLTEHEISLLKALCKHSGHCVSRASLLKLFATEDSNILRVYISHLRTKLEAPFGIKVIYTVRSKGYMTDYSIS